MLNWIQAYLRAYFVKRHGEGAAHQSDFYRCQTCGALITWNKIRGGDLCCSSHVVPANPTLFEKIRLFLFPWSI